jgi:hypothetical protein
MQFVRVLIQSGDGANVEHGPMVVRLKAHGARRHVTYLS